MATDQSKPPSKPPLSIPPIRFLPPLALAAALLGAASRCPADDITFADFESDRYAGWVARGAAFGDRPAEGTLPGQMAVEGFAGKRLVNSFHGGDGSTGTLTSEEFVVPKPFIAFSSAAADLPGRHA